MEHVYSSIDIGSDSIKLLVCQLHHNKLNLLAATSVPSEGIKRGLITDPKLAKASIAKAFKEVSDMLGINIKKVIALVPNQFADYTIISSQIKLEDGKVTSKDMMNAYKMGIRKNILPDKEFVNIIPVDFKVDDKVVKNPKDMIASTLQARAIMVTVPKKNVYSVASILESLDIEIVDIATSGIVDVLPFKNQSVLSSLGVVVNIGSNITTVSLYHKGIPIKTKIISTGGIDIDKDIAYAYKVSMQDSRKLKETFALAYHKNADSSSTFEVTNFERKKIKINQVEVTKLVEARLIELISNISDEINSLTNKNVEYIIVTGGMSNLADIEYLFHQKFDSKIIIGQTKLIGARDNKYSASLGNIIYFLDTLKLKGQDYTMISHDDMEVLETPNRYGKSTTKDTMLGKVFGYFFEE